MKSIVEIFGVKGYSSLKMSNFKILAQEEKQPLNYSLSGISIENHVLAHIFI